MAGDRLASPSPLYAASRPAAPTKGATVQISSLPNHLLSDAMMNATLDQAQLEDFVVGFITKPGAQRGEALITLSTADAAVKCARHFHGRRWDASGITVDARVLGGDSKADAKQPMKVSVPKRPFAFSSKAAEFVPGVFQTAPSTRTPTIASDSSTEDGDSASNTPRDSTPSSGSPREITG